MRDLLKKYFGYENFRPLQEAVITHVLAGRDALVLMPTGGGKSLCYQLPALTFPGLTVVVSPLIALMKDQVDALRANGIPAAFLNSSLKPQEMADVEAAVAAGRIKLLYLAPERLAMPHVRRWLAEQRVSLFAIDEAHCISEWGHDFRPDYRNLRLLRTAFPAIPMLALTATANGHVKEDIVRQLGLANGKIFQSSFNRPNLTYRVVPKKKSFERLLAELRARPGQSAIVYCFSRNGTEKLAADLKANGIAAAAYHAGLSANERTRVQDKFIRDQIPVIAATIAFGMGIDKPDVRLVAHMDLPKSVEGYYQETGRAGRDGLPSDCLLFYSIGDRMKHEYFIRMMENPEERDRTRRQLAEMIRYADLQTCRRHYLLTYFGEQGSAANCGACDICVPSLATVYNLPSTVSPDADFNYDLFEELRALRRSLADARGVPPYVIFGDRSLQDMARYYPQSLESMAKIFGVGREKLAQFGERFLSVIVRFAQAHDITERANTSTRVVRSRRALSTTVLESLRLFESKKTPNAIAMQRKLSVGTVLQHLEEAAKAGRVPDVSHISFPPDRLARIEAALQGSSSSFLTPVKQRLGENYGYDEIRLARFIILARK